jgi:hypothetical protein
MGYLGVTVNRTLVFRHVEKNCTIDEYAVTQTPKAGKYSKPCNMVLTFQGFISAASSYLNDQGRKMRKFTSACTEAIVGMAVLAQIREREHKQTIALLESKNKDQHDVVVSLQCTRNKLAQDKSRLQFENTTIARENRQIEKENLLLSTMSIVGRHFSAPLVQTLGLARSIQHHTNRVEAEPRVQGRETGERGCTTRARYYEKFLATWAGGEGESPNAIQEPRLSPDRDGADHEPPGEAAEGVSGEEWGV